MKAKQSNHVGNIEAMQDLINALEAKVSRLDREIEWCKLGAWAGFHLGAPQLKVERAETLRLIRRLKGD